MALPELAWTYVTPLSITAKVTSKYPPPRLIIMIFVYFTLSLSQPQANAAALGSFISLMQFNSAFLAASLVAYLCLQLKLEGTEIMASMTGCPKKI